MRSLTDTAPKPLLQVQGQPLLQWHLAARQEAGDKWCSTLPGWERRSVTPFLSVFGLWRLLGKREQLFKE